MKQMFNNMDTDRSGTITLEELKVGLSRLGSKVSEAEVKQLMEAVSLRKNKKEHERNLRFSVIIYAVILKYYFAG